MGSETGGLMKTSHSLILVGALSLLGGILALFNPFAASLSVGILVGWTLLIVGLIGLIGTLRMGGGIWPILFALMTAVIGFVMVANPMSGLIALTVTVAIGLVLSGIARIALARANQGHPAYWVLLLSGALSVLMAIMIFGNFPQAAEVVLGLFLGIELVLVGMSFLGLGFKLKSEGV